MLGISLEFFTNWGFRLAVTSPVIMVFGLGLFRLGLSDFLLPLGMIAIATLVALLALLLSALAVLGGLFGEGLQVQRALIGLAISLAIVIVPLSGLRKLTTTPVIHDITTDTDNPPLFQHVGSLRADGDDRLAIDPEVIAKQKAFYVDLAPLQVETGLSQTFARAVLAAESLGWEVVASDAASGHIEAVDTTAFFGFKDDVVLRLSAVEGGTRIDMRSASRVGESDLGANATRIQAFFAEMQ
jgi:uncharacterized protein (DUF1499 family)